MLTVGIFFYGLSFLPQKGPNHSKLFIIPIEYTLRHPVLELQNLSASHTLSLRHADINAEKSCFHYSLCLLCLFAAHLPYHKKAQNTQSLLETKRTYFLVYLFQIHWNQGRITKFSLLYNRSPPCTSTPAFDTGSPREM